MVFWKKSIRNFLRYIFGLEVYKLKNLPLSADQIAAKQMVCSLLKFGIDLVLDVGSNKGQFASDLRQYGYAEKIVSFEPLSQAHNELVQACKQDSLWDAYPRCAIGDHDGVVEINIAGNSDSSSILPMLEMHLVNAPQSAYRGKETVPIKTLDAVAKPYLKDAKAVFLKIDTQGFEWQVLDGASEMLPHVKGVMVELSLMPLYEGQRLWRDIVDRLEAEGFILWSIKTAFADALTGQLFQVDGVFYRKKHM